jgi:adenine/guanine phosphoribosyltransferase-like PRPP-binding protein
VQSSPKCPVTAQNLRELSVRRKLNAMPAVFEGRSVLLVDDSIVRGTTMRQIVDMVRRAGAKKVGAAAMSGSPALACVIAYPRVPCSLVCRAHVSWHVTIPHNASAITRG